METERTVSEIDERVGEKQQQKSASGSVRGSVPLFPFSIRLLSRNKTPLRGLMQRPRRDDLSDLPPDRRTRATNPYR
jgi:hypothetical protein